MDSVTARPAWRRSIVLLCALLLTGCRGWPRIDPTGDRFLIWPGEQVYPTAPPPLVPDARPLILAPPPTAAPYISSPFAPRPAAPLAPMPAPNVGIPPATVPPTTFPPTTPPLGSPPAATPPSGPVGQAQILMTATGPAIAGVGSRATYRITLSNVSSTLAQNLVVKDEVPTGLEFLNSNPASSPGNAGQEWSITTLGPRETRVIEVNYRIGRPGKLTFCANYSATGNLTGRSCTNTVVPEAKIDVNIRGLESAAVGSSVRFEIDIINRSDLPATGVLVTNRFDVGLEHAKSASPIERDLKDIPPGGMERIAVTFRLGRPGELCQTVEVTSKSGQQGMARSCITALAPTAPPGTTLPNDRPSLEPPPGTRPPSLEPNPAQPPANTRPPLGPGTSPPSLDPRAPVGVPPSVTPPAEPRPSIFVKKTGPTRRKVGEMAEFVIEVTNTGNVPLNNVRITDNYETSMEPVEASEGYSVAGGALTWTLPTLAPAAKVVRRVNCRCLQEVTRACNRVTVNAEGLTMADEACLEVLGEGAASKSPPVIEPPPRVPPSANPPVTSPDLTPRPPTLPLVPGKLTLSIADTMEPVKVGGETTYDIIVKNDTQSADKQVVLSITASPELGLVKIFGPVKAVVTGNAIQFEPVAEIRAGETLTYQLQVSGKQVGTARVKVEVSSQRQIRPVTDEETTSVIE